MENTLRKNLFWDYLNRFGSTICGLITSIILARILTPNEFGVVGIAMAVNAIGAIFLNLGFVNGIIQSKSIDNKMLSTAFYINLAMSVLIYGGIFLSSKWVSNYYGLVDLENILKISGIAFIFNAMSLISYAQLNREMKFKLIATVDLTSGLVSGFLGIYLALNNFGIWSIVFQQLANSLLMFFCFLFITRWMPNLYFNLSSISSLLKFGKYLFLYNLIETLYSRFDIFLIARIFNINTLGLYTRAQGLEGTIRNLSSASLLTVLFPAFSLIKENISLLRESYYKYFELICFIFFFLAGIFYIGSSQLFLILFGAKWDQSAMFFKIMILAGFSYPLCNLGVSIVQSRGNSKNIFLLEIVKRTIQIPSYFIAYFYGINAFLISYVGLGLINTILNVSMVDRELNLSIWITLKYLFNYMLSSFFMIFIIQSKFNFWCITTPFFNTLINIFLFSICYLIFHYCANSKALITSIELIKSKII